MQPTPWTDYKIQKLRECWAQGMSARDISNEISDVTRCAIIGKARRLGLETRPSPIKNRKTYSTRLKIVDEERFIKLWRDPQITIGFMMKALGCSNTTIYKTAARLELGQRPFVVNPIQFVGSDISAIVEKKPKKKGHPCHAKGCPCEAVPGALVCYAHGCGEIIYV